MPITDISSNAQALTLTIIADCPVPVERLWDAYENPAMPSMRMEFRFESTADGSRFTSVTVFPSLESMEQLVQMGMVEGTTSAMRQIDAVLADLTTFAASRATEAQRLGDTQLRVSRVIRGSVAQV